jgi:hypothetical protein
LNVPYVKRDGNGLVVAKAAAPQEGWPLELLPDTHPDVAAFNAAVDLLHKRADALAALRDKAEDGALTAALNDPNAPQAVKDYKAAKEK